ISQLILNGETLYWELATLITIMLLGHWMEMRAVQGAQGALNELAKLLPDTAEVIRQGKTEVVPLSELKVNDLVLVKPGSKIPADGVIIEGGSDIDESLITGESRPVKKMIGDEVIAGSINGDGSLTIKVNKIGEGTFLYGIMRLVRDAQASKSRIQILSDKAAFYLTIIAIISGSITLFAWISFNVSFAFERLVSVLVIACPHALGLAVPLVASISTTISARNGFLVKQRLALEAARNIDIVLFDKTGTLTKGAYGITNITASPGFNQDKLLQYAASIETLSEHFIAKAIVNESGKRNLKLLSVKDFKRIPGKGIKGNIGRDSVFIGNESLLNNKKIPESVSVYAEQGMTVIYIIINNKLAGFIALADIIREESRAAVKELKNMKVKTAMITGDAKDVAEWVSSELGIDEYFAKVLPNEKSDKVKTLQSRGLRVAMVGDGVNDAPALTQSDVGIAIGAGTNVAIESAGIILVRNDPRDIVKIINLSRKTYSKMIQNLWWAAGYNIVAIPLAAGVLYSRGVLLQPALAALFMSLSTIIVAINASLLKRIKL
ncbi:MAG TPA: heavy metal translocating P-type ATPase, partial [Candidatus Nanoarchaeia archaeon]|nr:heavy metal translocating P-type ATPase [Candidatus Nanoarchaeia archaeon]